MTAAGAIGAAAVARHSRVSAALSGAALLGGSALTRFGLFEAGMASARDPKFTVEPQRERLRAGEADAVGDAPAGAPGADARAGASPRA